MRQNTCRETVGSRLEQRPMVPPRPWYMQGEGPQEEAKMLRCRIAARRQFDGKQRRIATLFRSKCMPDKITLAICHLELPSPSLSPTCQFLAGISFGKAVRVDAALATITMPGVIRIFLNFDFRQPALLPIAMSAAPCSSTNSLTKPTIP